MSEIRPSRVSLVKRPANKREFLLIKSEDEMDEIFRIISETEADCEATLVEALKAAEKDEKTIEAALAIARVFDAYSEDITKADFDVIQKSLGFEVEKAEETEEITKSDLDALPETVRAKVEKLQSDAEAASSRMSEIEKALSEKAEAERLASWKERVSGLDNVAKSADELAQIVKDVADTSGDEAAEAVIEALRSANSTKSEDFVEDGSSAPGDEGNEDAYELAKAKAKAIVDAEGVSFYKAMQMVTERNPELANRYSKAQ
jgi:hypothetical protein